MSRHKEEVVIIEGVCFWNEDRYYDVSKNSAYEKIREHCFSIIKGSVSFHDKEGNPVYYNPASSSLGSIVSHGANVAGCTKEAIYFSKPQYAQQGGLLRIDLATKMDKQVAEFSYVSFEDAPQGLTIPTRDHNSITPGSPSYR